MNSTKDTLENETPHFGNTLLGAVPTSEVYLMDCIAGLKHYPNVLRICAVRRNDFKKTTNAESVLHIYAVSSM